MIQIYQYTCELQIKMPHLAFRQSNELHMQAMLSRNIPGYGTVDTLPMWFYFYLTPINDPLTILHHQDGDVEIHPGTNRFIGRSIRDDQPWLDARIISIGEPWSHTLSGIRNERLLKQGSFDYTSKRDFYSNQELYRWSFGTYAPTGDSWLEMPEQWSNQQLGQWGGQLTLNNGQVHYVNRKATKWIKVSQRKHLGLMSATQRLFRKLAAHVKA
jgi:hypothetical protein